VAEGVIPKDKADDMCVLVGVFIHWDANDDNKIYDYNYKATKESIARALGKKPTVDEVIASSKSAKHPYSPK
jgi:5,6,7,8-tetrahydromethanopterin hydro-lyase